MAPGIKSGIGEYLSLQTSILREKIPIIMVEPEEDAIHRLRVSIKKIRVVYGLFEFISPASLTYSMALRKTDALFKAAGNLRDTQVQILAAEQAGDYPPGSLDSFLTYLAKKEQKQKEKVHRVLEAFRLKKISKLEKMGNVFLITRTPPEVLREYKRLLIVKRRMMKNLLITQDPDDDTLHDLRRVLKEYHYLQEMGKGVKKPGDSLAREIKRLEECLGLWHDRLTGLVMVRHYRRKGDGHEDAALLEEIYAERLLKQRILADEKVAGLAALILQP